MLFSEADFFLAQPFHAESRNKRKNLSELSKDALDFEQILYIPEGILARTRDEVTLSSEIQRATQETSDFLTHLSSIYLQLVDGILGSPIS